MSMGSDCDDTSRAPAPASREGLLTFRAAIEAARNDRKIGPAHEPKRLRVYVSGKMTGMPFLNYPAFIAAGLQLTGAGFDSVNPATLDHSRHDGSWASHMRVDIKALMDCDGVALLPGWEDSKGACVERDLALVLGMDVHPLADWLSPMAGRPRTAAACTAGQTPVCAETHSVRQATQCRCSPDGCADGQCPGRVLPGAVDSEGGDCA